MTSRELENLVRIGKLKQEAASAREIDGLLHSAEARLTDAANPSLALESRFDLAYNAAHALALIALRRASYRCDNRYLVFQALPHTLGTSASTWRVLAKCHEQRNLSEYEGVVDDLDDRLMLDLLRATQSLLAAVRGRPPVAPKP
jgi:hypothetical protein